MGDAYRSLPITVPLLHRGICYLPIPTWIRKYKLKLNYYYLKQSPRKSPTLSVVPTAPETKIMFVYFHFTIQETEPQQQSPGSVYRVLRLWVSGSQPS